jgi:hypothetical protein
MLHFRWSFKFVAKHLNALYFLLLKESLLFYSAYNLVFLSVSVSTQLELKDWRFYYAGK